MHVMQTINRHRTGGKVKITTKQLVRMATLGGAEDLGLDKVTGSLTPGKRADLLLVRTTGMNMRGMGDPYDALVQLAHAGDVDTVVADGRILLRKGKFTALDYDKLTADGLQSVAALKAKAKWT
jgi:cytosine/adenosine deaminase-related metal-dependent hydrolase